MTCGTQDRKWNLKRGASINTSRHAVPEKRRKQSIMAPSRRADGTIAHSHLTISTHSDFYGQVFLESNAGIKKGLKKKLSPRKAKCSVKT